MQRNNKAFIATDLGAIILDAEINYKKNPNQKIINPYPTIDWDDASEEMRNDKKIMWITNDKRKYTFRKLTTEEKAAIWFSKTWKLQAMFEYILEKYG